MGPAELCLVGAVKPDTRGEKVVKIVSIVGARPQFIKAAAVSREMRKCHREILIHTGQHYDYEMSGIFFDRLEIPAPHVNLGVGSGSHGTQTAAMLKMIEDVLFIERPNSVVVYGDTNSTLAGALAASKLSLPVIHVEAGLRSFNRSMPEEINRVVVDHLSNLLLCPSNTAVRNLAAEGISQNIHFIGDVMLDVLNWARQRATLKKPTILRRFNLEEKTYLLATIHRSGNTENCSHMHNIINALNSVEEPIVFPVHPRTRRAMREVDCRLNPLVRLIDPVDYLEMVALSESARMILTDSGGLQKEAYWLGVPCLTLRDETEWVETVDAGWNILVGADSEKIIEAVHSFLPPSSHPTLYGDGSAAARFVDLLETACPFVPACSQLSFGQEVCGAVNLNPS
jgi:UDP-GlcNAc3NAcA epimerase